MGSEDVDIGGFTVIESSRQMAVSIFINSHTDFLSTLKVLSVISSNTSHFYAC